MIIAMLFHLVLSGQCKLDEIMISVNVAIKNEIKKVKSIRKNCPSYLRLYCLRDLPQLEYKI